MKIPFAAIGFALAAIIIFIPRQALGKPAAPEGLLVNGVSNPLAIDPGTAKFTWQLGSSVRGNAQTAYQVLVSGDVKSLETDHGDWWDSGKVNSDRSASIECTGKQLPAGPRFYWKVRIWDQTGEASPWSAPAYFDRGLDHWAAQYIWDGTTNENNFAYFRKTFSVTQRPKLAKVFVTAHNDYMLYFNGQMLGRGPARCDPYHYGQYNAYDVTNLVQTGGNVLAAIGHWQGNWNDSGIDAKPGFMLEARLEFGDGASAAIGTDTSWKVLAHTAFIETNPTYFSPLTPKTAPPPKHRSNPPQMWTIPEDNHSPPEFVETDWGNGGADNRAAIQFDSRREPDGWRLLGFDDSHWASATIVDRSNYHLFAQMAPLEREQAELKPVIISSSNGVWLVDFGRCIDGWPKLKMHDNRAGDRVRVQYFEMAGAQMPAGWDEYICHGGQETWDADFGRHATFQMLKISGYAGTLRADDVSGMWAYCDADVAGSFNCSSHLLNDIYKMCVRSAQQSIQQGIISVDANREQSPWTADSWNIGNVLLYNDRNTMMIDKVVRDYAGEQLPNGDFPACCPAQRSARIAEWSMYWPMLLWQQYLFSGDQALLREMAPRLVHFLDWIKIYQDQETKLLDPPGWRISDWAGGNTPHSGQNMVTACQYYNDLQIASRIFSVLDQKKQSDEYLWQAEEVKAGINAHLFNGEYYLARTDRKEFFPLASAWALRFDIVPEAIKPKLVETIKKAGKPDIGGYGGDAFYSGMLHGGAGDFVVSDLDRYRSMLESNQANWESFFNPPRDEVNHAWTSYPGYLFLKYMCGIQPTSGGFATFDLRPETGGLSFAEGKVPTVKGMITTRWEKHPDGRLSLSVGVPGNTLASVYIPKVLSGKFVITESGKDLWPENAKVDGVLAIQEQNSCIKCVVGAGDYQFEESPRNP